MSIEVLDRTFGLHTAATSYVFCATPDGLLRHLHWGGRIAIADVIEEPLWGLSTNDLIQDVVPQEYPAHGRFRYSETSLTVRFGDGGRELDLRYADHATTEDELVVHLADAKGVEVDLHYQVLPGIDVIRRWAVVRAGVDIVIEAVSSAHFPLPYPDLTLRAVAGRWGAEFQEIVQPVRAKTVLEARRGVSNHHHNPFAVLFRDATEGAGQVWGAALEWGGNTRVVVERTQYGQTLVQLGINDADLEIGLAAGEQFRTPAVVATTTDRGFDALSQNLHDYGRSLMSGPRPVLYNSWEATNFDVTCDGQIALAERAARIGAELFVVDDGWFGRRSPNPDGGILDGLGDWWVDPTKFPDGLTPLIEQVHRLGMRFGLWVEPEMVNPQSDLYRAHPEWIYREPGREPDPARGQYVLNLTLPEVAEFVLTTLDGLLTEHEIAYLKWDANRPMSQVGPARDVWYRHLQVVYEIAAELKARHPGLLIEACASGGGRVDFGTLSVFDDFWTSDNTDALDRLDIHRGYSLVYPPQAMRAWVTDVPNFLSQRSIPLEFRFHSAMTGSLGIGSDLAACSDEELAQHAKYVAEYKELRPLLHRLHRPEESNGYRFFQYAGDDGAVLFAFLPSSPIGHGPAWVRLLGLDPGARYRFRHEWQEREASGAYLMNRGLRVWLFGDYASTVIRFDRV